MDESSGEAGILSLVEGETWTKTPPPLVRNHLPLTQAGIKSASLTSSRLSTSTVMIVAGLSFGGLALWESALTCTLKIMQLLLEV